MTNCVKFSKETDQPKDMSFTSFPALGESFVDGLDAVQEFPVRTHVRLHCSFPSHACRELIRSCHGGKRKSGYRRLGFGSLQPLEIMREVDSWVNSGRGCVHAATACDTRVGLHLHPSQEPEPQEARRPQRQPQVSVSPREFMIFRGLNAPSFIEFHRWSF